MKKKLPLFARAYLGSAASCIEQAIERKRMGLPSYKHPLRVACYHLMWAFTEASRTTPTPRKKPNSLVRSYLRNAAFMMGRAKAFRPLSRPLSLLYLRHAEKYVAWAIEANKHG
jgi:hypothetical protein